MAAPLAIKAAMDLANSFAQEDIPVKLRCAICSKLVVNAFRLPCCDQSICEACQSALPESCPVCAHSPLSADDCKPNKALRLTVKAFLKSEEKKRDKERAGTKPITPVTPAPSATPIGPNIEQLVDPSDQPVQSVEMAAGQLDASNEVDKLITEGKAGESEAPMRGSQAPEQQTNEGSNQMHDADSATQNPATNGSVGPTPAAGGNDGQDTQNGGQNGEYGDGQGQVAMWNMNGGQGQQMYPGGFSFDASAAGYTGMGWNGAAGFNPMMQMQSGMPNGIQGSDWSNYSAMMGMPGINVGPISQGMFGGYGGQGMGMNGMTGMNGMNMGVNYGGGYGTGWNGQQMSSGDFGGAGYYPGGGYNQSSQGPFPHQMHHQQQQYPKNNFQNQNRFHGQEAYQQRGYGRGHQGNFGAQNQSHGYSQTQFTGQSQVSAGQNQPSQQEEGAFQHQLPAGLQDRRPSQQTSVEPSHPTPSAEAGLTRESSTKATETQDGTTVHEHPEQFAENRAEGEELTDGASALVEQQENNTTMPEGFTTVPGDASEKDFINAPKSEAAQVLQPIATVDTSEPSPMTFDNSGMNIPAHHDPIVHFGHAPTHHPGMMNDYSSRGRGGMRVGFGRGAGYEFRGGFGGRGVQGGGFMPTGAFGASNTAILPPGGNVTVLTPGEPRGLGVEGAPTGPKAMREGRPNTGVVGRGRFPVPPAINTTPDASVTSSQPRPRSKTPVRDDALRIRSKSRSRSKSPERSQSQSRSRSRSPSKRHRRHHRQRSTSPSTASESHERRKERRRYRSYREGGREGSETLPEDTNVDIEKEAAREDRSRSSSVESSKHRSRRDREKHRSSRSRRDRSREHRRHRHRSRSRSPVADNVGNEDDSGLANGAEVSTESSSRRKSRSEKYRERDRERERDRDRDRDRDRERERDRDKDRDKDRERDRDRKRSRRDRSRSVQDEVEEDRHHRSSRRSRKDREKERDRENTHSQSQSRDQSPPLLSAPTAPSKSIASTEVEFKIQGRSKARPAGPTSDNPATTTMPPPTQPTFQPPKGPAAERNHDRERDIPNPRRRHSQSHSSTSIPTTPLTPTTPTTPAVDPHTLEREARNRERMLKEQQRRASLQSGKQPSSTSTSTVSSLSAEKKRSREDTDNVDEKPFSPPTGPSAHRRKRRRGSEAKLESRVDSKGRGRRVSYKYEDEENDEARARRVEREREESRWG